MADYLPIRVTDIIERKDPETGEVRLSAVCMTVQPETFNLNLSKLDAHRLQIIKQGKGGILMVPIRRGEIEGRAFTSIAPGYIFPAHGIESSFELKDTLSGAAPAVSAPRPAPTAAPIPNPTQGQAPAAQPGQAGRAA